MQPRPTAGFAGAGVNPKLEVYEEFLSAKSKHEKEVPEDRVVMRRTEQSSGNALFGKPVVSFKMMAEFAVAKRRMTRVLIDKLKNCDPFFS